jgi:hypothetical protein
MHMTGHLRNLFAVTVAAGLTVTAAAAESAPQLLGSFKEWTALQSMTASGKTCYVMSTPKSKEPAKAKRDPVYFLISDWPVRHARAEPQIVPGYEYKPDSTVTVQVGAEKFELFSKNSGGAGSAWVQDTSDEARLVDAMKRGSTVVVTGVSQRGTTTKDTYSLNGISAALDKIHASCGM